MCPARDLPAVDMPVAMRGRVTSAASAARRVDPEWLDALPPSDPRALRSRRDLERVNAIMRHAECLRRMLTAGLGRPPAKIIELGGGDGRLLLAVAKRIGRAWPGVVATIVDPRAVVAPATREAFAALGWRVEIAHEDAESYLRRGDDCEHRGGVGDAIGRGAGADAGRGAAADAIIATLFLHHLEDEALRRLFAQAAHRASLFAACEPRRSAGAAAGSRLLWAIGCNDVSRHDAVVSVRAGFTGRELSALWPSDGWQLDERRAGLFTHAFVASRTSAGRPASGAA
jgi:hypothetical protein